MNRLGDTVRYGKEEIPFAVVFTSRKTLAIEVRPDLTVVVTAPAGTAPEKIRDRVARRAGWIRRQLNDFSQYQPATPPCRYVGGETHLYLGKRYRLKIGVGRRTEVKLTGSFFRVEAPEGAPPERIKAILDRWYARKARERFQESFEQCWPRFEGTGLTKPRLRVQRMKKRWGSLSKRGNLTLNTGLVRAPRQCIDYVIIHEMCHLAHPNHGKDYLQMLDRMLPDWEARKKRLERITA
jgi:predicted metal-dependent hydrolase